MSKHPPLEEIINLRQRDMLDALRDAPAALSFLELQQALATGRGGLLRNLSDLRERELVDVVRQDRSLLYSITRSGSRALARYKRRQDDAERVLVAPPTFNTRGQPYVPSAHAYYRNEGNKHIGSRGFSC
jgi:DNA-binding MarR family transcriptional regulator